MAVLSEQMEETTRLHSEEMVQLRDTHAEDPRMQRENWVSFLNAMYTIRRLRSTHVPGAVVPGAGGRAARATWAVAGRRRGGRGPRLSVCAQPVWYFAYIIIYCMPGTACSMAMPALII